MKLLLALLVLALQTTQTNGMGTKKNTGVFGKVKSKFKDKGGGMQIYIKPKLGRRVRLDVEASDMIADIKVQIEDSPFLPPLHPNLQRLRFAGEQLQDGDTVSDYKIEHGSVLYLGGSICSSSCACAATPPAKRSRNANAAAAASSSAAATSSSAAEARHLFSRLYVQPLSHHIAASKAAAAASGNAAASGSSNAVASDEGSTDLAKAKREMAKAKRLAKAQARWVLESTGTAAIVEHTTEHTYIVAPAEHAESVEPQDSFFILFCN